VFFLRLGLDEVEGAADDVEGFAEVAGLGGDFFGAQLDGGWVDEGDVIWCGGAVGWY